jgi:hypothetical protein
MGGGGGVWYESASLSLGRGNVTALALPYVMVGFPNWSYYQFSLVGGSRSHLDSLI